MMYPFDKSNMIALLVLTLPCHTKMLPVHRLEKRLSETIDAEIKERLGRHLVQTREQQGRLKERIKAMGGEPITESGRLPIPELPDL